jgi:endonuclease/exonuclease/phosphatase (EEP) superfamily protein YafD
MRLRQNKSGIYLILFLVCLAGTVPLVLGFFGETHPALDAFSHLRAHLSVALFLLALPLFFSAYRREAMLICLFSVMCFATTTDYLRGQKAGVSFAKREAVGGTTYSLLQINMFFDHPEPQRILQAIGQTNPDVITYQEASLYWEPWLKILEGRYPYHLLCKDYPGSWGVGILSRRSFVETDKPLCVGDGVLAAAQIDFGGQVATVASLHLSWPWPKSQPAQLKLIEPYLRGMKAPMIIAGDFNAVSWSNAVKRVEQASNTYDVPGLGKTWLLKFLPDSFIKWLGVQIDHFLVSSDLEVHDARTLNEVGSDHLPLSLDFGFPVGPATEEDKVTETVRGAAL